MNGLHAVVAKRGWQNTYHAPCNAPQKLGAPESWK